MASIYLETYINAPLERVFDLSRSIDLHKLSTKKTNEEAIAGRTAGLIELYETVTWRAKHLGIYQKLTVQIIEYCRPEFFTDVMLKGAFASMKHKHQFKDVDGQTLMIDYFDFTLPLGVLGQFAEFLFLKKYMTDFLVIRNNEIKEVAESERWKELLSI